MIDIVTMIEYLMPRLCTALHEEWLDGHVTLRRCVHAGRVSFDDLLAVSEDIVALWQPIPAFCSFYWDSAHQGEKGRCQHCVDQILTFIGCCSDLCDVGL